MSLNSADVATFETSVRERALALAENEADASTIKVAFDELSSSPLPSSEVARRAGRLAQLLPSTPDFQQALATAASASGAAVRSAVVALLPAPLQQATYDRGPDGDATVTSSTPDGIGGLTAKPAEEPAGDQLADSFAEARLPGEWQTVLLLGRAQDTAENARLLKSRGFSTVRVSGIDQLNALARERICGLIVHKSWWQQLADPAARASFVREQVSRANLVRMKIDCRGLGEAETLVSATIEGFDAEVRSRITAANDSLPTEVDLRGFEEVANLLNRAEAAQIGIEGVDESDRHLIASAVESFASREHLTRTNDEERLTMRPVFEGESGAKVLSVRSAAFRTTLVAKLAPLIELQDELDRARRAMPPSLQIGTELCLYSLSGKGVLLQRLYTDFDQPDASAPSLRQRLAQCAAWERGSSAVPEPSLPDLEHGIDRMVAQIKEVNRIAGDEPESSCWLTVEPLENFVELDMRWSIESLEDTFDPTAFVSRAQEIVATQGRTHVIHGDLHTGNLLMQDDRTPSLIDFAKAGTGHPCFDLVRISSSIAYEFIRPLVPEETLRQFFFRTHVDGASKDALLAEFPELLCGIGSRLAVHTLTTCRGASIESLGGVDETEAAKQYLAMVYLIGAQSLTIPGFQALVVRSALGAIRPRLTAS